MGNITSILKDQNPLWQLGTYSEPSFPFNHVKNNLGGSTTVKPSPRFSLEKSALSEELSVLETPGREPIC